MEMVRVAGRHDAVGERERPLVSSVNIRSKEGAPKNVRSETRFAKKKFPAVSKKLRRKKGFSDLSDDSLQSSAANTRKEAASDTARSNLSNSSVAKVKASKENLQRFL